MASHNNNKSSSSTRRDGEYGYPLNFDWKHPWPRAPMPNNEEDRLAELARYRILETEPDEKFDKLCRIACKEMKCPIAAVSFIDKQKQWFKANSGLTQRQIPRDVALCAHTIMHAKRALVVEDTSLDERFQHNPLVTRASAVRFYAGVPITTPNGFCIGSVFVFDVKGHHNVDAKILHKIAAKVLKYMDERLKNMAATNDFDLPTSISTPTPTSRSNSTPPKRKTVSPTSQGSTEQPAGETALREQQITPPTPVKPEPAAEPLPDSETTSAESGVIVQSAAVTSTAIESQGQGQGGLGNMGSMLMNLLARTTETQQQLAAQQGVMFETLGEHSNQLDSLGQSMSKLEKRFEQVRILKEQQQRNATNGSRRPKHV
ncbi:unnamed protein product [Peronospora destructor]|uniref:GAF domain-containing protein n=1 Tax=Peronospora destructor TaxID=86335 RepID=A0AAV0VCT4_9STRA|nr:unnamed protein product [Peronospora destructor]